MSTTEPRRSSLASIASSIVIVVILIGSFTLTDDAWPLAPLRMFSHGNKPDGVVRNMRFEVDFGLGPRRRHADDIGLRRSELEEQTPWRMRVPDAKLEAMVRTYQQRHPRQNVQHFQVVVVTRQMKDSRPVGEPTTTVIGDWASPSFTGERAEVDLPLGPETWPGHSN